MEQHPVPQNVTTFQFRLIGDMTLKQFGYLIGGAIAAYIMYKLPLPFFFTWPLAVFSVIAGFGLAFVPVEERPMDVWVLSFFKSIYNPTQYVWSREAPAAPAVPPPAAPAQTSAQLPTQTSARASMPPASPISQGAPAARRQDVLQNIFLPTSSGHPAILTATPKRSMFDRFFSLLGPKTQPVSPQAPTQQSVPQMDFSAPPIVRPNPPAPQALKDKEKEESVLEDKLKTLEGELKGKTIAETRVAELQSQISDLLSEREKMKKELGVLQRQSMPAEPVAPLSPPPVPKATTTTQSPAAPTVQVITADRAIKAGLPRLTTFPNVVTGIVKDKDRNLLPGVIVTVKDRDGVPLRALKTNRLGQFAASTQLPNGTYFVEVEDPRLRFTFDRAQITLNGTIVPALEIFAKTEKEITRAKLEKELFGKPM